MTRAAIAGGVGSVIVGGIILLFIGMRGSQGDVNAPAQPADTVATFRFLAVGDVNLGRRLGQRLLAGDTMFPWTYVHDSLLAYDAVFANLESNLSDQNGRTEDPRSNTIFTGPPCGAASLKRGGISVVSTANNHALDFGLPALQQTRALLAAAGVGFAGTGDSVGAARRPVIMAMHGIRVGLFACTALMNDGSSGRWKRWVADTSSHALAGLIRSVRDSVDFVIVSVHGGTEYGSRLDPGLRAWARGMIASGADVVLAHHPHVPLAVEEWKGGVIAGSLGNFVFKQPFQRWTQRSYALALEFHRTRSGSRSITTRCIPVAADYQPRFVEQGGEYNAIIQRVCNVSTLHEPHQP